MRRKTFPTQKELKPPQVENPPRAKHPLAKLNCLLLIGFKPVEPNFFVEAKSEIAEEEEALAKEEADRATKKTARTKSG